MSTQTEAQKLADWLDAHSNSDYSKGAEAAAKLRSLEAANAELLEALNHAVEIAEARRPGVWDDLLQYRAAIKKHGGVA